MIKKIIYFPIICLLIYLPMIAFAENIVIDGDFSTSEAYGFGIKWVTPTGTVTGTPTPVAIPAWTTWAWGMGGPIPITTTTRVHFGTPVAQVGNTIESKVNFMNTPVITPDYSYLEQKIKLPNNCTTALFRAYCNFYSENTSSGTSFQYQKFEIRDEGGSPLSGLDAVLLDSLGNTISSVFVPDIFFLDQNSDPEWWQYYIDLQPYSGRELTIYFEVKDDGYGTDATQDAICMWVDDVSLDCITATPTATPTVTVTSTISATYTITPTITQTYTVTPTYTTTPTITPTCTITPVVIPYGKVVAYPNPASGRVVNFGYSLERPAHVYIDIFNLMGCQVAHLEDMNQLARANRVTTWNIKGVAQGVYFYRVIFENPDGSKTELKKEKLVIVH